MDLKSALIYGYQLARTAHFAGQQISLPFFERLATGRKRPEVADGLAKRRAAFAEIIQLLKKDSENIANGLYPAEVLKPENPAEHWWRYGRILWDGVELSKRRQDRDAHDFAGVPAEDLQEIPEYYRRNFHYQTGGYLTEESADLYEHQVEILFAGAADAMRRLLIPLMKEKWPGDGQGLHFLEVGAGTGRLSRFMRAAYPKARITVTDLSWAYLKTAQQRLSDLPRMEFVRAAAEELPFKDQSFDAVYSCFLFHELPEKIRHQVIQEALRVLKPAGAFGLVDSLQMGDGHFDWALEQFPKDFHEPFFTSYARHPMENLLSEEGLVQVRSNQGFLSKALLASKT